jgi:hypothetical protein
MRKTKTIMKQSTSKKSRPQTRQIRRLLEALRESVAVAVETGDWKVDGRNDPEMLLAQINEILPRKEAELALAA